MSNNKNSMTSQRQKKLAARFAMVPENIIFNPKFKVSALHIYQYCMSKINWKFEADTIKKDLTLGKYAYNQGMQYLREIGHFTVKPTRLANGKWHGREIEFHREPVSVTPPNKVIESTLVATRNTEKRNFRGSILDTTYMKNKETYIKPDPDHHDIVERYLNGELGNWCKKEGQEESALASTSVSTPNLDTGAVLVDTPENMVVAACDSLGSSSTVGVPVALMSAIVSGNGLKGPGMLRAALKQGLAAATQARLQSHIAKEITKGQTASAPQNVVPSKIASQPQKNHEGILGYHTDDIVPPESSQAPLKANLAAAASVPGKPVVKSTIKSVTEALPTVPTEPIQDKNLKPAKSYPPRREHSWTDIPADIAYSGVMPLIMGAIGFWPKQIKSLLAIYGEEAARSVWSEIKHDSLSGKKLYNVAGLLQYRLKCLATPTGGAPETTRSS